VKAAAPPAPGSTQSSPKTPSKGLRASRKTSGVSGFEKLLARAVSAKDAKSVRTGVRIPVPETAARNLKSDARRPKIAGRDAERTTVRRRADEVPAAAQPSPGRTAAAVLSSMGAAVAETRHAPVAARQSARTEPRIQVVDLRKKPAEADAAAVERSGPKAQFEKGDGSAPVGKPFAERFAAAETAGKAAPPAHANPLERIREMTGSDLVRTAGLVVRDGGGEIRLTLKPESLGSVRIRLSLEDGKIEGRIIVDTPEARQAFEAGLDSLTRALNADGFQTGSLQVSVGGGNANDSRQAAGLLGDTITGARLRTSDEALRAAVPPAGWTGNGDGLVDVFA
jgi:Flagellar hook-length control protein FliK